MLTSGGTTTTHHEIIATTNNQLIAGHNAGGSPTREFTYRAGGDLSTDDTPSGPSYTYTYDARKRLSRAPLNGAEVGTYGYDYLGHRVWRSVDGCAQTQYVYDEDDHPLAEYDGATGNLRKEYVWLDDTPVAMIDSSSGAAVTNYITAGRRLRLGSPPGSDRRSRPDAA